MQRRRACCRGWAVVFHGRDSVALLSALDQLWSPSYETPLGPGAKMTEIELEVRRIAYDEYACQNLVRDILSDLEARERDSRAVLQGLLTIEKCAVYPSFRKLNALGREAEKDLEMVSGGLPERLRTYAPAGPNDAAIIDGYVRRIKNFILADARASLTWETWVRYNTRKAYEKHVGAVDTILSATFLGLGTLALGFGRRGAIAAAATGAVSTAAEVPKRLRRFFSFSP
jgi:hypothetical protein